MNERDGPREYDREFTTPLRYRVRRRIGYSTDRGEITRFVVQLEYHLDGRWATVVRFDHDPASELGHDVTDEGVHMDVYRDGEKVRAEEVFPPMPADEALTFAEEHLIGARRTVSQEVRDMARDRNREMTEAEFEAFRESMDAQADDLRRALAADLGGDPEDYRAGERLASDGGE